MAVHVEYESGEGNRREGQLVLPSKQFDRPTVTVANRPRTTGAVIVGLGNKVLWGNP